MRDEMALDRDILPRNQSLSNNSIKNPKPNRELRVEYSSVKQEARISDKTDAQIRTQPIGLIYCAPKLKKVLKVVWTVILLAYVIVLPILVMMLFRDYSNSVKHLDGLEEEWKNHLDQGKSEGKKRPTRNADNIMKKAFTGHTNCSRSVRELKLKLEILQKRLAAHEKRIKTLIQGGANNTSCICKQLLATPVCTCDQSNGNGGNEGDGGENGEGSNAHGPKGERGPKGDRGPRGIKGSTGVPGSNATCKLKKLEEIKISTVFFRWGRKSCPKNSELIFMGFMATPYISDTRTGGGTNYVCLPSQNITYKKFDHRLGSGLKTSLIDGVKYGNEELFKTRYQSSLYGSAVCSMCQSDGKSTTIMIPGNASCPAEWAIEYKGFLMADSRKKTQFICVDESPEAHGDRVSQNHNIGTLEYVSAKWPACFSNDCGMYDIKDGFRCVVCSM